MKVVGKDKLLASVATVGGSQREISKNQNYLAIASPVIQASCLGDA